MPAELFTRGPTLHPAEQLPPATELSSEAWEAKRDAFIDKIQQEVSAGNLDQMDVAELAIVMAQYSLKDALLLAKHIPTSAEQRGTWMAALIGTFDRTKSSHGEVGNRLRTRIMEGLDVPRTDAAQEVEAWATTDFSESWQTAQTKGRVQDLAQRALKYPHQGAGIDLRQEPHFAETMEALAIPDDRPEANLNDTTQPLARQIEALYTPFYGGTLDRGSHDIRKKVEAYPGGSASVDFLDRCKELETKRPLYLHSLRELIFRKRFGIPAPTNDPSKDPRVVFDHVTEQHLPLATAIDLLEKNTRAKADIEASFNVHRILWPEITINPSNDTEIDEKSSLATLAEFGIQADDLDVQVKLRQAQVRRLDLVLRIQAKLLRKNVQEELQQAKIRLAKEQGSKRPGAFFLKKYTQTIIDLEEIAQNLLEVEKDGSASTWAYGNSASPREVTPAQQTIKLLSQKANTLLDRVRKGGAQNPNEAAVFSPAKVDDFSNAEVAALIKDLFPVNGEKLEAHAKKILDGKTWYKTPGWQQRSFDRPLAQDYLSPKDQARNIDGDPRDTHPTPLAKLSEPIDAILVTGVFQTPDSSQGFWERGQAQLSHEAVSTIPHKTVIVKVPANIGMMLPTPLLGRIHDRVIATRLNQSQVAVQTEQDDMGRTIVKSLPADAVSVSYAVEAPEYLPSVRDIPQTTYAKWYAQRLRDIGHPARAEEAKKALPMDCVAFLDSVRGLPPAQQVQAIESYARSIGYYDFANGETRGNRVGVDLKTRWKRMRERLKTLQAQHPDNQELQRRKVAGVCTDYQEIVSTLLNAAGFVSGKIGCLRVHGETEVDSKSSHALSYVEWPNERGGFDLIPVDGTPPGTDTGEREELALIQEPSLRARQRRMEAGAFEQSMDTQEALNAALHNEQKAQALDAIQRVYLAQKTEKQELAPSLAASPAWRERFTRYIEDAAQPSEQKALAACISWLAYSGVARSITGERVPSELQEELRHAYTNELAHEAAATTTHATEILRDWARLADICRKQGTSLRAIGQALEIAAGTPAPRSKQKRVISYLVKGFSA